MRTDRIFLGDIMYGYHLVVSNAVLVRYKDYYIDFSDIVSKNKTKAKSYTTIKNEKYYVKNLVPFYEKKKQKTLIGIRYDVLSDSRVTNFMRYIKK